MLRFIQNGLCRNVSRLDDRFRRRALGLCAGCCAGTAILAFSLLRGQAQSAAAPATTSTTSTPAPAGSQQQPSTGSPARDPRQVQVESQCADLVRLAAELKAEINKSGKDQLSLAAIREATQIEELARKVKTENAK